jgi:hypothetical protein
VAGFMDTLTNLLVFWKMHRKSGFEAKFEDTIDIKAGGQPLYTECAQIAGVSFAAAQKALKFIQEEAKNHTIEEACAEVDKMIVGKGGFPQYNSVVADLADEVRIMRTRTRMHQRVRIVNVESFECMLTCYVLLLRLPTCRRTQQR